ncbi:hypothetical protein HMI56_002535 [Coelomomyces lativittatus]|nr:hypothetical protein HMI56_002535 [Coelomomyces lativittatus]
MATMEVVLDEADNEINLDTDAHTPTIEERRETRKRYRDLQRSLEENRNDFVNDPDKLLPVLEEINVVRQNVVTMADMTLDSSLLLQVSNIVHERLRNFKPDQDRFDIHNFVRRIAVQCGLNEPHTDPDTPIDYTEFAQLTAHYLYKAPAVTLIMGPINVQVQRREYRRQAQPVEERQVLQPTLVSFILFFF